MWIQNGKSTPLNVIIISIKICATYSEYFYFDTHFPTWTPALQRSKYVAQDLHTASGFLLLCHLMEVGKQLVPVLLPASGLKCGAEYANKR